MSLVHHLDGGRVLVCTECHDTTEFQDWSDHQQTDRALRELLGEK